MCKKKKCWRGPVLWFSGLGCHLARTAFLIGSYWHFILVEVPAMLLLIPLPANVTGKATEDGSSPWARATQVG